MKLLDLFITSSIPVGKILVITGIGFYLALDRVNILNQDARKQLNNVRFLNIYINYSLYAFVILYVQSCFFSIFTDSFLCV